MPSAMEERRKNLAHRLIVPDVVGKKTVAESPHH